jgi:hypothetical protein
MKRCCLLFALSLSLCFALFGQSQPSIQIVNNTGYPFYYLYISPSGATGDWGDSVLGRSTLARGSFTYRLPQPLSRVDLYT